MDLTGIHHLTAITADAPGNNRFYTETLGLRRVKKTVNQDDTSAYHLFFADGAGSPGTDLTFFDWPVARERRGTHAISRTGLRVAERSLDYWAGRLHDAGLTRGEITQTDGRGSLDFDDPEGQRFRLTADAPGAPHPWERSPVPPEHQIRGLGPITISVPQLAPTEAVLTHLMNMRAVRDYASPDGAGPMSMCSRWAQAGQRRRCMSPCNLACPWRSKARVRCIMSRSVCLTKRHFRNGPHA